MDLDFILQLFKAADFSNQEQSSNSPPPLSLSPFLLSSPRTRTYTPLPPSPRQAAHTQSSTVHVGLSCSPAISDWVHHCLGGSHAPTMGRSCCLLAASLVVCLLSVVLLKGTAVHHCSCYCCAGGCRKLYTIAEREGSGRGATQIPGRNLVLVPTHLVPIPLVLLCLCLFPLPKLTSACTSHAMQAAMRVGVHPLHLLHLHLRLRLPLHLPSGLRAQRFP